MGKRVILTLMEGSFEQGFPAILRISEDGAVANTGIQVPGKLPPAPNVVEQFFNWQLAYRQMVMPHSRIKAKPAQVTNISCHQLGDNLVVCLNDWLNSGSREWQKIRDGLQRNLSDTDEIQVLIQTNDLRLRQLPWHLWNFFEHYPLAEVALSVPEYQQPKKSLRKNPSGKVRILAIIGNSTEIDIGKERAILEQLSYSASTEFLVEPQLEELNDQLWEKGWDILFFAGHSSSQEKGQILLNKTDSLTLDKLKYALKKAISRGLRLAIFNSCDGLGLAQQLACLHIGQVIVMREPVPDVVAQEFFRHFLAAFSGGQSLYASVREARERLQRLESKYPYATWLPVICQNPAYVPTTWQDLCGSLSGEHEFLTSKRRFQTVLLLSVVVTALVMGVRQLGLLEALELRAFDQLQRRRPDEGPDPRLLVVTVSEEDIQAQDPKTRTGSLSDAALAQLLEKLEPYQPRVIGLDIYRDFSVRPDQPALAKQLRRDGRFVAVCKNSDPQAGNPGVSPPDEVPPDRLGFSDVVPDSDGILRRYLWYMDANSNSPCPTELSFSLQLALRYLVAEGLDIEPRPTPEGHWKLVNTNLKRLEPDAGVYQGIDNYGYQMLLNYRTRQNIARTVTLTDILNGQFNPNWVRDRIVLIGVTAPSVKDDFYTPYSVSRQQDQTMRGVFVQAQMVSQILSAVLDQRPLLWVWPAWGEVFWVWGWSLVGGVVAWGNRRPLLRLGLVGGAVVTLYGLCFGLLIQGGWVPLVPSALALVVTGGSVAIAYTAPRGRIRTKWTSRHINPP